MSSTAREFSLEDKVPPPQPMTSVPKIPGGVRHARIGATFVTHVNSAPIRCVVREASRYKKAKKVARCLGYRAGGQMMPCPICAECAEKGENGLDEMEARHIAGGASDMQLKDRGEQHVFCLFSEDPLDPVATKELTEAHNERVKAYHECKTALERQALISEWGFNPTHRSSQPKLEIVGLVSHQAWVHSGTDVTM